jgi:TolB-like protein/class 3 adenylate cyclase/Tfp pilus assembly protein PilF
MADEGFKRKLTAILSADAVDYSRLMGEDEAATVRTLKSYREVLRTLIRQHSGLVLDSPGDNLLAEFASVVDAVQCAVAIQKEIKTHNNELPENRRMKFRIGINLGDVIEEKGQIYGDGVNVAARIEGLADSEGICISRTVYDQVKNKLELGYEYLGEHTVKNIADPVRVYRVLLDPEAAGKVIGEKKAAGKKWRRVAIATAALFILVAAGFTVWNVYLQRTKRVEAASIDKMAYPLPDKPSIAVMPFINLSGDPGQEYLGDSISENLISSLSQLPKVFVIARGSTFSYKGKAVKTKQVSEELGVQYVVEGSVQRSGNRIRITAQIIDAIKGYHVWGDRYDRAYEDIFALQDDIILNIIKAIQLEVPKVFSAGMGRETNNLEAYLKFLQGYDHLRSLFENFDQRELKLARGLFEEAIALDQDYAKAYVMLGSTYVNEVLYGWSKSPEDSFTKAFELSNKSLTLNPDHPGGHALLSFIFLYTGQHSQAVAEVKQALEIDPYAAVLDTAGQVFTYSGMFEDGIAEFERLLRLDPYAPGYIYDCFSTACFLIGKYDRPIPFLEEAAKRRPDNFLILGSLGMAYSLTGRKEEAQNIIEKYCKNSPIPLTVENVEYWLKTMPFKNESDRDRLRALWFEAGMECDISQSKSN